MSVKSNSRSGSPAKMSRTFSPFLSRAYSEIACWIRRSDRPLTMMYPPRPLSASASISCRIGVPGSQEEMTKSLNGRSRTCASRSAVVDTLDTAVMPSRCSSRLT